MRLVRLRCGLVEGGSVQKLSDFVFQRSASLLFCIALPVILFSGVIRIPSQLSLVCDVCRNIWVVTIHDAYNYLFNPALPRSNS